MDSFFVIYFSVLYTGLCELERDGSFMLVNVVDAGQCLLTTICAISMFIVSYLDEVVNHQTFSLNQLLADQKQYFHQPQIQVDAVSFILKCRIQTRNRNTDKIIGDCR